MFISPTDVRHVLHYFGDDQHGVEPGGFVSALLTAMTRADPANRAKLSRAFPQLGVPFEVYKSAPRGPEVLVRVLDLAHHGVNVYDRDVVGARPFVVLDLDMPLDEVVRREHDLDADASTHGVSLERARAERERRPDLFD